MEVAMVPNRFMKTEERYRKEAERLWDVLDDIDTALDACKGDHVQLARYVAAAVAKRHIGGLHSPDGHQLVWGPIGKQVE